MKNILAIDAGGTKCEALLVREDGTVLGWGRYDGVNPETSFSLYGNENLESAIDRAVRDACADLHCRDLIITYMGFEEYDQPLLSQPPTFIETRVLSRGQVEHVHYRALTEHLPALSLAGEEYGIVVVAGTGATVYGRTRDGRILMLDGLGPMLGDYGSAFHIGTLALRSAARSDWHPRWKTSLKRVVYRLCKEVPKGSRGAELIYYAHSRRARSELAAFARFVDAEANAGDAIARGILEQTAGALAETVFDLVDSLHMADEDYPLVAIGSVAVHSTIYWEHLCSRIRTFAPRLRLIRLQLPHVLGFAMLGLQSLNTGHSEMLRNNLLESAIPFLRQFGYPVSPVTASLAAKK